MRAILSYAILLLGLSAYPAAASDTASDRIYDELMDLILGQNIGYANNASSHRAGDENPYRQGFPGYRHKALAACFDWNAEDLKVSYRFWRMAGNRDWSSVEFNVLKRCRQIKQQRNLDCTCQVIDHDDENVLDVPADFLESYERKHSAQLQ